MPRPPLQRIQAAIPPHVGVVVEELQQHGHQAFLVGGCVRDLVLGPKPQDWDVATDARPERVLQLFSRAVPTGVQFGTVTVPGPGGVVEVTTFRREWDYRDGRRPARVSFGTRVEDDLARRDFTVNAMAADPGRGTWVDPFQGLEDSRRGLLRAVGDPRQRFHEDGLRLLRAVRLANQLQFEVEAATWRALGANRGRILLVAPERCRGELDRLLGQTPLAPGLEMLQESGLLYLLLPEVYQHPRLSVPEALAACAAQPAAFPLWRWAGLLAGVPAPGPVLERLRFSRRDAGEIMRILGCLWELPGLSGGRKELRKFLARLDSARELERLQQAVSALRRWEALQATTLASLGQLSSEPFPRSPRELAVDGRLLQETLGLESGPHLGRLLHWLWEETLEEPERNHSAYLLARARELQQYL